MIKKRGRWRHEPHGRDGEDEEDRHLHAHLFAGFGFNYFPMQHQAMLERSWNDPITYGGHTIGSRFFMNSTIPSTIENEQDYHLYAHLFAGLRV